MFCTSVTKNTSSSELFVKLSLDRLEMLHLFADPEIMLKIFLYSGYQAFSRYILLSESNTAEKIYTSWWTSNRRVHVPSYSPGHSSSLLETIEERHSITSAVVVIKKCLLLQTHTYFSNAFIDTVGRCIWRVSIWQFCWT